VLLINLANGLVWFWPNATGHGVAFRGSSCLALSGLPSIEFEEVTVANVLSVLASRPLDFPFVDPALLWTNVQSVSDFDTSSTCTLSVDFRPL
jgi:hypothetical protein